MSPEDSYNKIKKQAAQIESEQWRRPSGTSSQIIKDGHDQILVAREDKTKLVEAGMAETLIDTAETALLGYSWVDGLYATTLCSDSVLRTAWESGLENGFNLRGELFKFGDFGIRRNRLTAVKAMFTEIKKGIGPDDMIMDLKELNQFFVSNPTVTAGLKQFVPGWVEEALMIHNELTDLRTKLCATADNTNLDKFYSEKRGAFTLYQNAIDEVREWGQFVFDGTERAEKYRAQYLVGRGGRPSKKDENKPATEVVNPQM